MALSPDFSLNVSDTIWRSKEFDGFKDVLRRRVEEIRERVPIDGSLTVNIQRLEGLYRVSINVVARALQFSEAGEGQSPFVALENAVLRMTDSIKVWSLTKDV